MIAELAARYLEHRRITAPSLASWRVLRSKLSVFLEFLESEELEAPAELTKEAERLIDAVDPSTVLGLRDRAMLEILYATGVRASELLSLHLTDLTGDETAPVARVRKGKGGKGRLVPLGQFAQAALVDYLERGRSPWASRKRSRQ